VLEHVQHRQPRLVRQADVQHDGVRGFRARRGQRFAGGLRHLGAEAHLLREVADDLAEGDVVLNDQDQASPAAARLVACVT